MLNRAGLVVDVEALVQFLVGQSGRPREHLADLGDAAVKRRSLGVHLDPVAGREQHGFADVLPGEQVVQHLRHILRTGGSTLEQLGRRAAMVQPDRQQAHETARSIRAARDLRVS